MAGQLCHSNQLEPNFGAFPHPYDAFDLRCHHRKTMLENRSQQPCQFIGNELSLLFFPSYKA